MVEAFLRDGEDALDEGAMCWLADGGEAKERADGSEPRIARACRIAPILLDVVQEGGDKGRVDVCEKQVGRRLAQALLGEAKEKPEAVAVGGNGVGARLPLALEALDEECLEQGRQGGRGFAFQARSRRSPASVSNSGVAVRYQ